VVLTDILNFTKVGGFIAGVIEGYIFLLTDNARWITAAGVTLLVAGIAGIIFHRLDRDDVDQDNRDDHSDDHYWNDAADASEAEIALLDWDEMAARFAALDDSPSARVCGYQAQRRDRLCLRMRGNQRAAWLAIVSSLDMEPVAPRCTCGVMRGVLTPSRECAFHGVS
jgi:hypothetical protein